jgi:hypothetical protein
MKATVSNADFIKLRELLLKSAGKESLTFVAPDDMIYPRNVADGDRQAYLDKLRDIVGHETVNKAIASGQPLAIQPRR